MKHKVLFIALAAFVHPVFAETDQQLLFKIQQLQKQTKTLQNQINQLQQKVVSQTTVQKKLHSRKVAVKTSKIKNKPSTAHAAHASEKVRFHTAPITVHALDRNPDSIGFYPTALVADEQILTYIAGTPVVSSPYLGDRPAFDGSDYIVNISSINRDIRLMQQRRRLFRAYENIGYPVPHRPIIALSGKLEPVANFSRPFTGTANGDITLGSSELDVAAILNNWVEGFIGIAFDEAPPPLGGQRISNSSFDLNLGFVNIGDLDRTPFYFTAGQLYVPFGKYASAMVTSPITLVLARTKTRPFIFGYKSQNGSGPYAAAYVYRSDTTLGSTGVAGFNAGYIIEGNDLSGDLGGGYIGSMDDSGGMQSTGSTPLTTFGGFGSITNGSEAVHKVGGLNLHGNLSFDRYTIAAEWVGATSAFHPQDLSFNGNGAKPQAAQVEGGVTFKVFDKPASIAVGYQWSKETLALNLPESRISGVFNISIWKDTVESLEYRHDADFNTYQFANGAAPPGLVNANTVGTGKTSDTVVAQIGVYF